MKKIIRIHLFLFLITCVGSIIEIKAQPNIDELFNKARENVTAGKYDDAIQDLTKIVNANPNNYKALLQRGICYWAKKEIENSELQKDPAKAYRMEAEVYSKLKPGEVPPKSQSSLNAIADLTKAIQLNPNQYNPYNVRGNVYLLEKDLEPAINDFQKVTELKPDYQQETTLKGLKDKLLKIRNEYANSLATRANYLSVMAGYEKASKAESNQMSDNEKMSKELFEKAIQYYSPYDFYTFQSRGNSHRSLENWNEAISDYNEALKFKPNDIYTLNQRAGFYQKLGQSQKALDEFSRIIAMQNVPQNEKFYQNAAYFERAKLYSELGKLNEAIVDFDKTISINPKYYIAYFERGKIHAKKGNKQLARADFLKAGEAANLLAISQKEIDILDGRIKPESTKPVQTNPVAQKSNSTAVKQKLTFQRPAFSEQVVYEGEVVNGKANGNGTAKTSNGDVYEGDWKDNDFHGKGFIRYAFGDTYDGWWQNGRQTGFGTYNWANGDKYVGKMENFVLDGLGQLYKKDGTKTDGYWVKGKYIGKNPPTQIQSVSQTTNNSTSNLSNQLLWRKTTPTDIVNLKQILGFNSPSGLNFLCRAEYADSIQPGIVLQNKCNIGYAGKAVILENFEVYLPADNPNFELLAIEGEKYVIGRENDETPIYLCYLNYQNWWLPGKIVNGNCNYIWRGIEYHSTNFTFGFVSSKSLTQPNNFITKNNNINKKIDGTIEALEGEVWLGKGDAANEAKNYSEALNWYRKASEKGYERASYNIGTFYYTGLGVKQNYTEAMIWFKIAAEKGYGKAMFNIAVMYYNGQGVVKNNTEAVYWFRKAANKGVQEAKDALKKMNLSEI